MSAVSEPYLPEGDVTPRRSPEAVIADYLAQFSDLEQPRENPGPEAPGLIRWLHDEGWEIKPVIT